MNDNIPSNLLNASAEEISNHYGLYSEMIKLLKKFNVSLPGMCCEKNKMSHCVYFVNNRKKYIELMEKISKRLIQPIKKGVVYVSPLHKMFDYSLMTDQDILMLTSKGYISKNKFDWSKYDQTTKRVDENAIEEVVEEVVEQPIEESKPKKSKGRSRKSKGGSNENNEDTTTIK